MRIQGITALVLFSLVICASSKTVVDSKLNQWSKEAKLTPAMEKLVSGLKKNILEAITNSCTSMKGSEAKFEGCATPDLKMEPLVYKFRPSEILGKLYKVKARITGPKYTAIWFIQFYENSNAKHEKKVMFVAGPIQLSDDI